MHEKDIFDESRETKQASFACSFCGERNSYEVRWLRRTKKKKMPGNLNELDRKQFQNSRDYMVRIDDELTCKNARCRRRFEIPVSQSVVFV